ncbi:hypothetical protein PYW07_001189 [Mythimna separata]|uniref:RanBP-type and C3HC4-type zinc finger-containing protein 1 n=1 Tax=Mythimna separata TaxID=271217 RepID=A0AAD8DVL9_MYTSE|nr:hypothetical protein PYW07_001189 [Mythimna separata]
MQSVPGVMNNDVEVEGRPRPLSSGLWTLFSWLRRDERSDSSESLSSAGSDRTVASFAFLTPARYLPARGPLVVPPPGPPTDSYKKRVHDRNLRRHHDRDITLHRKYGLFKSEGACGYDAFSLPPARRINAESGGRWDRDRRATSECYQRRSAYVPGKRRAPLPPVTTASTSASLPRRYTRKRPAPQPPVKLLEKNRDILKNVEVNTSAAQMSSNAYQDKPKTRNNDVTMGCKSEKYSKKDASTKDTKTKSDKSFLKQIFDSKKRNSYIDTSAVKLLPSISELDKQAAEIIETCKLKATERNNNTTFQNLGAHSSYQADSWFCVSCLRKYDSTVVTCVYCATKSKTQSSETVKDNKEAVTKTAKKAFTQTEGDFLLNKKYDVEDKQKLREMLKEMKDSLPKRPKHDLIDKSEKQTSVESRSTGRKSYSTETPTLRVGSIQQDEKKTNFVSEPSTSNVHVKTSHEAIGSPKPFPNSTQADLVAQIISAHQKSVNNNLNRVAKLTTQNVSAAPTKVVDSSVKVKEPEKVPPKQTQDINISNTPLKISTLLNPMFVPKSSLLDKSQSTNIAQNELKNEILKPNNKVTSGEVNRMSQSTSVSTQSSNVLVVPSTSKTNASIVNIVKIDDKPKNNEGELNLTQKEKPSTVLTESRKSPELNNKPQQISKLPSLVKELNSTNRIETQDQHSRRRDLINQLEKSIARGDERAAAEAAAKLAQLRLSCSVLSFSSQIMSQPSTSTNNVELKRDNGEPNMKITTAKLNNDSNNKDNHLPQAPVKNLNESSPKLLVRKANPSAIVVPNKVTTSLVSKVDTSVLAPVQKKTDEEIQRKEKDTKKEIPNKQNDNIVTIAVLVEDREATRGPVRLRINRHACIRDLRREAETSLGLASNLQRWIVGRVLCVNDSTPIISLAGPDFSAPFYLCVVESEPKLVSNSLKHNDTATKDTTNQEQKTGDVYTELVQLEQQALVPNAENFECGVCMEEYPPGQGVVLRECVHIFCKDCLSDVVRHCEEPDVPCPAMGCRGMLQEREIRGLVPAQDYERWLARGLAAAESGTRNAFHCRTRDCKGWALCEPGVQRFPCPVCRCINCVPCQAIHDGHTCEQHRAKLKQEAGSSANASETDDGTRTLLNSLISKGEALECPECSAIITKKWGCDWVKCSACKTEICWVTRGRRWGPGGKGDTSGGCRCGVDGKRCHPSCGYCH